MIGCGPVPGGPGPRLQRPADRIGAGNFTGASIDALVGAAAYPEGFRLLFHDAAREPEFRAEMDRFHTPW